MYVKQGRNSYVSERGQSNLYVEQGRNSDVSERGKDREKKELYAVRDKRVQTVHAMMDLDLDTTNTGTSRSTKITTLSSNPSQRFQTSDECCQTVSSLSVQACSNELLLGRNKGQAMLLLCKPSIIHTQFSKRDAYKVVQTIMTVNSMISTPCVVHVRS